MLFALHTDSTEFLDNRQRTEVILVRPLVTIVVSTLQLEGIAVLLLHRRNGSSHREISLMLDVDLRGLAILLRMMLPRLHIQTARLELVPFPEEGNAQARRSERKQQDPYHEHTIAVSVARR